MHIEITQTFMHQSFPNLNTSTHISPANVPTIDEPEF